MSQLCSGIHGNYYSKEFLGAKPIDEYPIRYDGPLPDLFGTSFPQRGQEMTVSSMHRRFFSLFCGEGDERMRGGKGHFFDAPEFTPGLFILL